MKKSKLITGLSAAFIATMALMSCSSLIKSKSGVILTINGVPYTAEDLFNDQKTPAAAEAKFNAVYKAAVRAYFKNNTEDNEEIKRETNVKISEQKSIAQSNASKNGTSYATEWKKILKDNGVDNQKGLYDKFEYDIQKEKFETKFYEKNYDNLRSGDEEATAPGFVNYFTGKQPYHMKHILVKIDNLGDNNTDGTITEDEAWRLNKVITNLASGSFSFNDVSSIYSQDDTARDNYSSLGIMSRDTSFVDDFKLGTYFYEAFYGKATGHREDGTPNPYGADEAKVKLFGSTYGDHSAGYWAEQIKGFVKDSTSDETLGVIPYEAALALAKKTDDPENGLGDWKYEDQALLKKAGIDKTELKDKYLPRNIIFNKYFNKHNIMVIAPANLPDIAPEDIYTANPAAADNFYVTQDTATAETGSHRTENRDESTCPYNAAYVKEGKGCGFHKPPKNNDILNATEGKLQGAIAPSGPYSENNQRILRDENGRTIFVFRSGTGGSSSNDDSGYQGIHFVVIERSPFIDKEYDDNPVDPSNPLGDEWTSLDDYYTQYYPEQPGGDHPKYKGEAASKGYKHTFANYIMDEPEVKKKKDRADQVKSELKNCMPNLNTFVYDYLLKTSNVSFEDTPEATAVKNSIDDWVRITREDSEAEKTLNWNKNWQNYYYSLKAKTEEREEALGKDGYMHSRVVPEFCMVALTKYVDDSTGAQNNLKAIKHMFGVGGVFHD